MFFIGFTSEPLEYPFDDTSIPAAPGRLELGKSTEDFLANLSLWRKPDYESHWTHELRSLLEAKSKIALVVSYNDPRASSNMEIWRAYRDGECAHFQNQLLSYSDLPRGFEILNVSQHIKERQVENSEGNRVSEWNVAIKDIELFLQTLHPSFS